MNTRPKRTYGVYAIGHWSTRGNLEDDLFEWGFFVNGRDAFDFNERLNGRGNGRQFYKEIKPHLPDDYESRLEPPHCVPGGVWSLFIPVNDFKNPESIVDIVKKYFPKTMEGKSTTGAQ